VEVDIASLASIRSFATAFAVRGIPLELPINNAGAMALPKREVTVDGFERQFGTNHLGHFALTGLLLPQVPWAQNHSATTLRKVSSRGSETPVADLIKIPSCISSAG